MVYGQKEPMPRSARSTVEPVAADVLNLSDFPAIALYPAAMEWKHTPRGKGLWFAKTLADFEINDLAALPPLFCYNS
jgi:hypothetical protein